MATIEKRGEGDSASYRVKVRIKGEKPRTRTFKRLTDAKGWAKAVETDLGRGSFVPTTVDRRRTVADLIDKFIKEELPTRGHNADRMLESNLAWWKDHAGYVTLDKLTAETIAGLKSELRTRKTRTGTPIAPATVNRYLAALSAVCKWAWKELRWLHANPVLSVAKGPEHKGLIRYLSDAERKALFIACRSSSDPNISTAVALALATGARYGNLRNLTWADVDLKGWRLRFTHTKNDQPRFVPLVGPAQAILKAHFDRDPTQQGWVFKGGRDDAPADLDRPWREVRKAAGLVGDKHVRFHDLRHTTASYLTMNGASLAEVAEALGHRTLEMAKRYSHQSGEHVRSTFERISERLGEE